MTDDEIKELRRLHELIDAFQKRPIKDMAACADVAEAGQRMSKMLWEKLPALLTTAERVRELEAGLRTDEPVDLGNGYGIDKHGPWQTAADDFEHECDAATVIRKAGERIRDLEARLERAEKVVEIARTQRESAGGNGPFEFGYACSRTHAAVAALDANSKGIP
jgi:broad specificity phosphatase PhoE